jgi:hypothetical protein
VKIEARLGRIAPRDRKTVSEFNMSQNIIARNDLSAEARRAKAEATTASAVARRAKEEAIQLLFSFLLRQWIASLHSQ